MKILFKQCDKIEDIERINSIADSIRFCGNEAGFNNMSILDAVYEYRPDKYIVYSDLTEEEKYACEKYSVEPIYFKQNPYANLFRYKYVKPIPELIIDQICINDYEEHTDLMEYIDKRNLKTFRLFQRKILCFDCYCGYIPNEYHSLFLGSAKEVICNNVQSYYNHLISNEECVLTKNLSKHTTCQDSVLEHSTCFHGAYKIIGDIALSGLGKYLCK